MAEGIVDTKKASGNELNEDNYANLLETKVANANLSKILNALSEVGITAEELFICDQSEIKDIIKEQNMPISVTERIKFTKIVMEIKKMKSKQNYAKTTAPTNKRNNNNNIDLERIIQIGSDAMDLLDKLQTFTNSSDKCIENINETRVQAEKKVNTEYDYMMNEHNIFQKTNNEKIEFYRNLCIENEKKIPDKQQLFLAEFWKHISNPNQHIDEIKKQLTKLKKKVNTYKVDRKYNIKININTSELKKQLNQQMNHSKVDLDDQLIPLKLKCAGVNGNIVSLEWSPKPWEDPNNDILSKLFKSKAIRSNNFSFILHYCEYDDEQKSDSEAKLNWTEVNIQLYHWYETQNFDIYTARWKNKCELYLKNNTHYKFRMKFICKDIGSSCFGEVIIVKTLNGKPLESNMTPYKAIWSTVHRSKGIELKDNNQTAVKGNDNLRIRAQSAIIIGTKVMWEFTTPAFKHHYFGVIHSKNKENDKNEFVINDTKKKSVICGSNVTRLNGYTNHVDWIDNIHLNSTNNIKIIANYVNDQCELLFIVNNLILMAENKRYSLRLKECAFDEYLYPFYESWTHGLFQIKTVY